MKIDRLDAHDRLLHFTKQDFQTSDCIEDLIKQRPFGDHHFYVFCHPRTDEDGVRKRYIWQPRLTKPKAQTNSALYKVYPGKDTVKILWIIPPREMWNVYGKGLLFQNEVIVQSVHLFDNDRWQLEAPEEDDPSPETVQQILFEYQPQLFRRDTLPPEMQTVWDRKMAERSLKRQTSEPSAVASLKQADIQQ